MYKVIKYFTDLHDKDHPYNVGDAFPREGITVTEKRLAELAGSDNKQKIPLIELVAEDEGKANSKDSEALKVENDGEAPKKTSAKRSRAKASEK